MFHVPLGSPPRAAFGQRRKRVTNGLARIAERAFPDLDKPGRREALEATLEKAGIDSGLRPERIEPEAWLALARVFSEGDESALDVAPEVAGAEAGGDLDG